MLSLNANPLDSMNIHPGINPIDLAGQANNGNWVSLKGYEGCLVVLIKRAGTAGQDPIVLLEQSTDVGGGNPKALNYDKVRSKLHATAVPGLFTETDNPGGDNTYVDDTSAEKSGIIAVDIKAEDLDVDNKYDCMRCNIAKTGATAGDTGAVLYILYGAKYGAGGMISPIAN